MMTGRSPFRKAYLKWIFLLPAGIGVALFVSRWDFIFWPLFCFLVFLRVAPGLPCVGPIWRSMFGEKTLWDWLSLLIVPAALATLGFQFSLMNSNRDRTDSVIADRAELFQKYIERIQAYAISGALTSQERPKTLHAGDCAISAQTPTALIVQNITQSTLMQLQLLETETRNLHNEKGMILRFLYSVGSITRGGNKIDLSSADFSSSNLRHANLEGACLNNLMFNDVESAPGSASDLRYARLDGADLSGTNLARANLRMASLRNAVLTEWASLYKADLRGADLRGIRYESSTNFGGAIYNTKEIKIDSIKQGWLGSLVCGKRIRFIDTSRTCLDPHEYKSIQPTRFPDDFYLPKGTDPKGGLSNSLSRAALQRLTYLSPLVERNSLP